MACCALAQPAWSKEGAARRGDASLHRLLDEADARRPGFMIAPDFHLRVETGISTVQNLLDNPDGALRRRLAGSMMDFYPVDGQGFHVSGGMRFFDRANFARDAEKMTHGLLYVPRLPGGGIGLRSGYKRFTPAITLGYTQRVGRDMVIGLEAGTLLGRVNPSMPRADRDLAASTRSDRSGMNPIANFVLGFKF